MANRLDGRMQRLLRAIDPDNPDRVEIARRIAADLERITAAQQIRRANLLREMP